MYRSVAILDLATEGVAELIADFDLLVLFERLRHLGTHAAVDEIAAQSGVSARSAQASVDRLVALGLVEPRTMGRPRTVRYRAVQGPVVVTFDPADPKTAFRLSAARMALLSHLRRLGTARPSRATRKGAGWKRESVAVLPLEGKSLELVRSSLNRVDTALEHVAASRNGTEPSNGDRRPRFRVHVSVDPVEVRAPSLPVVLLMERQEAALRPASPPRTAQLSARERQVAEALAAGRTKREAADALGLSFSTVNTLAVRAYRKLGVRRRAQLAEAIRGQR